MISKSLGSEELSALLDGSALLLSDRLIRSLADVGLHTEELHLPKGKSRVPSWAWYLKRSKAKLIHYLWGSYPVFFYVLPKLFGKKVIIHWIGSDVLYATSGEGSALDRIVRSIAYRMVDLHLAVSQALADDLKSLGIEALVVPLVPRLTPFGRQMHGLAF